MFLNRLRPVHRMCNYERGYLEAHLASLQSRVPKRHIFECKNTMIMNKSGGHSNNLPHYRMLRKMTACSRNSTPVHPGRWGRPNPYFIHLALAKWSSFMFGHEKITLVIGNKAILQLVACLNSCRDSLDFLI